MKGINLLQIYKEVFMFQVPYMTVAWILCIVLNNGSMVDFAWPSGFTIMAIKLFLEGEGWIIRKLMIVVPFLIAGLRFMLGWTLGRKHYKHEDPRWGLWRERWRKGEGLFGIKSVPINFFFFYHAQSLSNVFFFSVPIALMCNNNDEKIHILEIMGLALWIVSFYLENKADFQLKGFKRNRANVGKVMQEGLWKYSRHPNYFFEFLLWVAYMIMSIPSVTADYQYILLALLPLVAYVFLVHFTGVPMAEQQSLKNRGQIYKDYQDRTNMFFPWFPKDNLTKSD